MKKAIKISVIIPTLNEEGQLPRLLSSLEHNHLYEVIICDGGSIDRTIDIVLGSEHELKLIRSEPGRAKQMNKGANQATGDVLLFLHADSYLSKAGMRRSIEELLSDTIIAGSFPIQFDYEHWLLRLYSRFSRINLSIFTYGDQGLFLKRSIFESMEGFRDMPIMEDIDMVRRLKKVGKFKKTELALTTSARRFRRNGILKQELVNTFLVSLFLLGVSPQLLSSFYKYVRD